MGCFNTVYVPCPKCGREYWAQTKSGSACQSHYALADADESELYDIFDQPLKCGEDFESYVRPKGCGAWFILRRGPRVVVNNTVDLIDAQEAARIEAMRRLPRC